MLYRNDTDETLLVATDPPTEVGPGDLVDVDGHVAGLTRVDEDDLDAAPPVVDVHLPGDGPAAPAAPTDPAGDPSADNNDQDPAAER